MRDVNNGFILRSMHANGAGFFFICVYIHIEASYEVINQENNKKLLDIEDFYLKSLLPDYNILTEAGSTFGYKHSDVIRIKMKANYSEERRNRIGYFNRDKSFSPKTKQLMRQSALKIQPISNSEKAIQNMKINSKSIIVKELNGIVYGEFKSIVDTAKSLNCSSKTIVNINKISSYKRIGPHNIDILSMIFGSLLGDSYAEKRNNGLGTRISLQQENKNIEYLK
ncbi:hypothetical protein BB558_003650 [Smittium angustum]|uniref:Uncharacterized protein n=1 Tax=Smittium angustum TaxID=133377 RepID=A0A2U1J5E2_SMIAN|nr:hypothetical protein BB558_003650 [Smittium angustum]